MVIIKDIELRSHMSKLKKYASHSLETNIVGCKHKIDALLLAES